MALPIDIIRYTQWSEQHTYNLLDQTNEELQQNRSNKNWSRNRFSGSGDLFFVFGGSCSVGLSNICLSGRNVWTSCREKFKGSSWSTGGPRERGPWLGGRRHGFVSRWSRNIAKFFSVYLRGCWTLTASQQWQFSIWVSFYVTRYVKKIQDYRLGSRPCRWQLLPGDSLLQKLLYNAESLSS